MVRATTTREVEWDRDEQALMLALAYHRAQTCSDCGAHLPESTDIANEYAYQAIGPYLCHSCETVGAAARRYTEEHPHVTNAKRWKTEKRWR